MSTNEFKFENFDSYDLIGLHSKSKTLLTIFNGPLFLLLILSCFKLTTLDETCDSYLLLTLDTHNSYVGFCIESGLLRMVSYWFWLNYLDIFGIGTDIYLSKLYSGLLSLILSSWFWSSCSDSKPNKGWRLIPVKGTILV